MLLAAIVAFTFDLSLVFLDSAPHHNLYFRLNQVPPPCHPGPPPPPLGAAACESRVGWAGGRQVLRERDARHMAVCAPLLYYLMRGLEALPPLVSDGASFLWRGVARPVPPPPSPPRAPRLPHLRRGVPLPCAIEA